MVTMNVDDDASVTAGVERVLRDAGTLDGVINCAGIGLFGAVEKTSDEEARALLETNLLGVMRVCRAVLPTLRQQGQGRILNISSIGGRIGLPYQGLYSATKFALEGLTEAMRMEAAPCGVQIVLIEPGDVHTQFTDRRKRVQASHPSSAYQESEDRVLSVVEKDERSGAHPESVARRVERVLACRSPRVRYTVGPGSQRGAVELKRVLPSRWFEWALSKYYGVRPWNGRKS
jgi:NAD(P)-dependent dehydrogenase (short-subunit alcohol dehydrogenase family)